MAKVQQAKTIEVVEPKVEAKGAKREKLALHRRAGLIVAATARKLQKAHAMLARFDSAEARAAAMSLVQLIDGAGDVEDMIATMPDDAQPAGKPTKVKTGKAKVQIGAAVTVRDSRRSEYEGLLSDAEMEGLKVVQIRGKRVLCEAGDGGKLLFPTAHVQPVQ